MAAGIADLGNGIGYIYKATAAGDIVSVERNTVAGVQAMQQMGVTNAPIAAQRSAYCVLQVLASGGTGSITSISINGVNQIGSPIVVTSTNLQTVTEQIVDAINIYSAPGFSFTANKPYPTTSWAYVYSAPADGTAVNGLVPIVSVTDPGIVITPTAFVNGSNDGGVYDDQFGYKFYMYADPSATPSTIPFFALDITRFITLRGSNTGIITINKSVVNDSLTYLQRSCDTTQVILDTSGGPTDILASIETADFVEGDILRIRNLVPTRVTTIEDATVNTTVATPNIYTTDAASFALTGFNSITLQYRYDSSLGPIWVETGRSITITPNIITLAQFVFDATNNLLQGGKVYYITDLGNGAFVDAINPGEYNPVATWIRLVPSSYSGCWRTNMAAPTIGVRYRHRQLLYTSLTGVVGTAPDTDLVNWQAVPINDPNYIRQYNAIVLTSKASDLLIWPVIEERDQLGNCVIQSRAHFLASGVNSFNVFCWSTSVSNFYGNYVHDSVFDVSNSDGSVYDNYVTAGSSFTNNRMGFSSIVIGNIFKGTVVTGNYITFMALNNAYNALIQNNGTPSNPFPQINANTLNNGYILNNTGTGAGTEIIGNNIGYAATISNNICNVQGKIRYNTLDATCGIINCVLNGTTASADIESCYFTGNSELTFDKTLFIGGDQITDCTFNSSKITITDSGLGSNSINNCTFNHCNITTWTLYGGGESVFSNCIILFDLQAQFNDCNIVGWTTTAPFISPLINSANVIAGVSSNLEYQLDLDDPTIYAANVLTIPYRCSLASQFKFISVNPSITIDEIVDLPNFKEITFYNETFGTCTVTFNKVSPAAWSGNLILGSANFVLNGHATGPSDYMTMAKYAGAANMITGGVNFV